MQNCDTRRWRVLVKVERWIPGIPRIDAVARSVAQSPKYIVRGQLRPFNRYFSFQYTLSGEGWFQDKRGRHQIKSGTGFLFQACDPEISYGYPEGAIEPWEFLYINFYGGQQPIGSMIESYGHIYEIPASHPSIHWLKTFGEKKPEEVVMTLSESATPIYTMLMELLNTRQRNYKPRRADEIVQMAEQYIHSSPNGEISVAELAKQIGITRAHLFNSFQKIRQTSPVKAITAHKIQVASELLGEEGWSCGEVAKFLGYKSSAHFTRMFKSSTGMNPLQYRKTQLALNNSPRLGREKTGEI
jgi:AraC-like DNA-binding protein